MIPIRVRSQEGAEAVAPPDLSACEFEVEFFDLYTETQRELRTLLYRVADTLQDETLRGPLYSITQEMAANALKALYKRVFDRYMIREVGLEHITYESWLEIFRVEMQDHHGENFARLCREKNFFIIISGRIVGDCYRIEASNAGLPSEIERQRIDRAISTSRNVKSLGEVLDAMDDPLREDTSLGIPLILLNLRGMGVDLNRFQISGDITANRTVARVDLPLELFHADEPERVPDLPGDLSPGRLIVDLYRELDYGMVRFTPRGKILAVSRNLLSRLNLPSEKIGEFRRLLPAAFFEDIFRGSRGVGIHKRFENYRIYVRPDPGPEGESPPEILFNVSGHLRSDGFVDTLWQKVSIQSRHGRLSEGSMTDSMMIHRLIEPYIPRQVLARAREAVHLGKMNLPEEVRELTIFFADLVGFTQKAEKMVHHRVMELLNLALGVCVRSIESNGGAIDKFMGDAVMAIFEEPLSAVVAALEIQNYFQQVNELRAITGEEPVHVRIGINSGSVIMGNIGTSGRMDYTAVGDVVNTASRIEKSAVRGRVLIGQGTFESIKDAVEIDDRLQVKVKGKQKELQLYFVKSVRFFRDEVETLLELIEEPGAPVGE